MVLITLTGPTTVEPCPRVLPRLPRVLRPRVFPLPLPRDLPRVSGMVTESIEHWHNGLRSTIYSTLKLQA